MDYYRHHPNLLVRLKERMTTRIAMIFSVANTSIFEIFDWQMFSVFYGIAIVLIVFPGFSGFWPLSSFSFLKKRGRWNGVFTFLFVSIIAVPHLLLTLLPLKAQKTALLSNDFVILEAVFDGQQPDKEVAWATFPETSLSFGGNRYEVPGSLHGSLKLLPNIRSQLKRNTVYRLFISGDILLKIEVI